MAVISLFGIPEYIFGSSIRSKGKPHGTGELLHWEIIKWLKEEKYKTYDLGCSPWAIPREGQPNYWVWRFKKGFNGDYVEFSPHYEYIFNKNLYWLFEKSLTVSRFARRLRSIKFPFTKRGPGGII